ncbi:MAG TPA: hypothetical protein P5144_15640 [Thermoanaerobaculia bacterium]|nr:hypothetical protein [Thermoanaerobaculia bacterium]
MSTTALAPVAAPSRFDVTLELFKNPASYDAMKSAAIVMFAGAGSMGMIPGCFKTAQQVHAAMLIAHSMGRDPILALQYAMPMPKDRVGWHYHWLMSLAEEKAPQYRWEQIELVPGKKFRGKMRASESHPWFESEFTIEMATQAGFIRGGSAWETSPDDMIFKEWWLKSARKVIPMAVLGIERMLEMDHEGETGSYTVPASMRAGAAPATDTTEQATSPAPPVAVEPGQPAPAAVDPAAKPENAKAVKHTDARNEFLAEAKKNGWNPRDGQKMYELLVELLTVEGVKPVFKSPADVSPADWVSATNKLRAKYGSKAEVESDEGAAGTAGGTTPTPAAEGTSEPAHQDDDEPASEPEQPADVASEADAAEAQRQDPMFLLDLCRELEKLWKSPLSVLKPSPKDKTKLWFANMEMLTEIGSCTETGAVQSLAFFATNDPRKQLQPQQVYALVGLVNQRIDEARKQGKK